MARKSHCHLMTKMQSMPGLAHSGRISQRRCAIVVKQYCGYSEVPPPKTPCLVLCKEHFNPTMRGRDVRLLFAMYGGCQNSCRRVCQRNSSFSMPRKTLVAALRRLAYVRVTLRLLWWAMYTHASPMGILQWSAERIVLTFPCLLSQAW